MGLYRFPMKLNYRRRSYKLERRNQEFGSFEFSHVKFETCLSNLIKIQISGDERICTISTSMQILLYIIRKFMTHKYEIWDTVWVGGLI